jgi:hypothetical protein
MIDHTKRPKSVEFFNQMEATPALAYDDRAGSEVGAGKWSASALRSPPNGTMAGAAQHAHSPTNVVRSRRGIRMMVVRPLSAR